MQQFAELAERLCYANSKSIKSELLLNYFCNTPDPERGYALAILTGSVQANTLKATQLKELVYPSIDSTLFTLSYEYVGDLAETVALLWPSGQTHAISPPSLSQLMGFLQQTDKLMVKEYITKLLPTLTATERRVLLKLAIGNLRLDINPGFVKQALAIYGNVEVNQIEELWHHLEMPYLELFQWLEGRAPKPPLADKPAFMPVMLTCPMVNNEWQDLNLNEYQVEWKWDGIRVQLIGKSGDKAIFTRNGEDISSSFPDLLRSVNFEAVLDGELLVSTPGRPASFSDLQQRLKCKKPSAKLMNELPAQVKLYDALALEGTDLRSLSLAERRQQLETWFLQHKPASLYLSEIVQAKDSDELLQLQHYCNENILPHINGLIFKRLTSSYLAGRIPGHWYKWKRDSYTVNAILMYAQRGHGKRESLYSDYTLGLWQGNQLLPIGKANSAFTDQELQQLDQWIRKHTVNRFGPVRALTPGLVFELAFEGVQRSNRHVSGFTLRFPRISRIRWDKPAAEADTLEHLAHYVLGDG